MFGILIAAAMATSFFMPWLEIFGEAIGPSTVLGDQLAWSDVPWRGWAFVASFALAALGAVMAMLARPAGVVMLIAGAIPYALIAETVFGVRDQVQDLGLPIPEGGNPMETLRRMQDFIELGLPAYFIAAALLIVIGTVRAVRGR